MEMLSKDELEEIKARYPSVSSVLPIDYRIALNETFLLYFYSKATYLDYKEEGHKIACWKLKD
jgi:hypothetical protein